MNIIDNLTESIEKIEDISNKKIFLEKINDLKNSKIKVEDRIFLFKKIEMDVNKAIAQQENKKFEDKKLINKQMKEFLKEFEIKNQDQSVLSSLGKGETIKDIRIEKVDAENKNLRSSIDSYFKETLSLFDVVSTEIETILKSEKYNEIFNSSDISNSLKDFLDETCQTLIFEKFGLSDEYKKNYDLYELQIVSILSFFKDFQKDIFKEVVQRYENFFRLDNLSVKDKIDAIKELKKIYKDVRNNFLSPISLEEKISNIKDPSLKNIYENQLKNALNTNDIKNSFNIIKKLTENINSQLEKDFQFNQESKAVLSTFLNTTLINNVDKYFEFMNKVKIISTIDKNLGESLSEINKNEKLSYNEKIIELNDKIKDFDFDTYIKNTDSKDLIPELKHLKDIKDALLESDFLETIQFTPPIFLKKVNDKFQKKLSLLRNNDKFNYDTIISYKLSHSFLLRDFDKNLDSLKENLVDYSSFKENSEYYKRYIDMPFFIKCCLEVKNEMENSSKK